MSIFTQDAGTTMGSFPFQAFGFGALLILFVMAATSHDFWLANLTAPVWKTLHMLVYVAYVFLVVHVAFGVLQAETHPSYAVLLGLSVLEVAGLHLFAGWRQRGIDVELDADPAADGFVAVCAVADLVEDEPLGVTVGGERVAVLRHEGDKISAVSGVCRHQNGPLAEGKFVMGCLTCPWHGYQYKPEDGCSPPPFTEKIPTFDFGNHQEFSGVLVKDPVPMLVGDDDMVRLLVKPLKFGFEEELAAKFHLKHVALRGTLIAREGDEMVEVLPESVVATDGREDSVNPLGASTDLGETELRGEIVNDAVLKFVAEPIVVKGRLKRQGTQLVLYADPAGIRVE